jgi:hypothetical protein
MRFFPIFSLAGRNIQTSFGPYVDDFTSAVKGKTPLHPLKMENVIQYRIDMQIRSAYTFPIKKQCLINNGVGFRRCADGPGRREF